MIIILNLIFIKCKTIIYFTAGIFEQLQSVKIRKLLKVRTSELLKRLRKFYCYFISIIALLFYVSSSTQFNTVKMFKINFFTM